MLTIRLSRIGKKNKPMYRLIISEKARDPYGRALEILGSYNPYTKELEAKAERITYWISQGAGTSATVNNLLIEKGIIKGEKMKTVKINTKKRKAEEAKKKEESKAKEIEKPTGGATSTEGEKPAESVKTAPAPVEEKKEAPPAETVKEEKPAAEEKKEEKTEEKV